MVQYVQTRTDTSSAAGSDATRRGVLPEQLGRADASITDLAEKFHMSLTGMKKHVGVLEQSGARRHRKGRARADLQARPAPARGRSAWIRKYRQLWASRFDDLYKIVEDLKQKEKTGKSKTRT